MRISTYAMHQNAIEALLRQQAALSRTQLQVATGRRILSPADDPAAAVHIAELERALAESAQFARNSDVAQVRLSLTETALANAGETLQRIRELVVQANTATLDEESRALIATEVRERLDELFDTANRKDANGEYLFAGYSTSTQPFVRTDDGIVYVGDQGARMLQIGPAQRIQDGVNGQRVFLDVPQQDMFSTVQDVLDALRTPLDSPENREEVATRLGAALTQLDRALDHLLTVRGEVGARLSALERAADARAELDLQLNELLSDLRDLDYAEAVSRMNRQRVGLEAAQLSYARISQLSLFDYLRL